MSTGIEWTDEVWNPVVGCTKVSQGCKLCYAKTVHDRRHKAFLDGKKVAPQYAHPFETVQLKPERLGWPLSLRKPSRIFVNSVSDLFHEDVPFEYIDQVFAVMALASHHTFQILTKRPARMREYVADRKYQTDLIGECATEWSSHRGADARCLDWPVPEEPSRLRQWPLPNVWLGVSVENQAAADERIPELSQTPAAVRFLSCEPLLGRVDLADIRATEASWRLNALTGEEFYPGSIRRDIYGKIDWVIVGGESGVLDQHPRPMHPEWARSLRDQCVDAGVPFLFKQWGDWAPLAADARLRPGDVELSDGVWSRRVGKKRAGRTLGGRAWDEYPTPSEVR